MKCDLEQICGGCPLRHLTENEYRQNKSARFSQLLKAINQPNISLGEPVFIADGNRRRAELTFSYKKGLLTLGFNAAQSHEIVNITTCPALTPKLNAVLPQIRTFLSDFCAIKTTVKVKNKLQTWQITGGEIWLTEADNGIDVLLEIDTPLALEHRLLISEFTQNTAEVIRFSCGKKYSSPETVAQKTAPQINIGGRTVFIPAGTFLQPSKAGEQALIDLVMRYVGSTVGNIADLFCGIGTFSYPLSNNIKNKITAVDSSTELSPLITTQSVGIFAPGFIITISSILSSEVLTVISVSFSKTTAVSGDKDISFLIVSFVFSLFLFSKNFPSIIKVSTTAADSK